MSCKTLNGLLKTFSKEIETALKRFDDSESVADMIDNTDSIERYIAGEAADHIRLQRLTMIELQRKFSKLMINHDTDSTLDKNSEFSEDLEIKHLISQQNLCRSFDMTRSGIDKLRNTDPSFPKPLKLNSSMQSTCYYSSSEVDDWLKQKLLNRPNS